MEIESKMFVVMIKRKKLTQNRRKLQSAFWKFKIGLNVQYRFTEFYLLETLGKSIKIQFNCGRLKVPPEKPSVDTSEDEPRKRRWKQPSTHLQKMLIGVLHAFASYVAVCVCDFKSFPFRFVFTPTETMTVSLWNDFDRLASTWGRGVLIWLLTRKM